MKIKFAYSPSPELLMTVIRSIPTLDSGSIVMVVHSLTEIVGHVRWGLVSLSKPDNLEEARRSFTSKRDPAACSANV